MDEPVRQALIELGRAAILFSAGVGTLWLVLTRPRSRPGGRARPRFSLGLTRLMLVVACFGCWFGLARWVRSSFATVYAQGYVEGRFRQVKLGMTRGEVEAILGPPLRKDATSRLWSPYENWIYTDPPALSDSYWRRWVMFDPEEGGRVVAIMDDYYLD